MPADTALSVENCTQAKPHSWLQYLGSSGKKRVKSAHKRINIYVNGDSNLNISKKHSTEKNVQDLPKDVTKDFILKYKPSITNSERKRIVYNKFVLLYLLLINKYCRTPFFSRTSGSKDPVRELSWSRISLKTKFQHIKTYNGHIMAKHT